MRLFDCLEKRARSRAGLRAKFRRVVLVLLAVIGATGGLANGQTQVVDFEDFSNLTLVPFDVANAVGTGDGTDFTKVVPDWTRDDNMPPLSIDDSGEMAYAGWSAMDVDSWISEQGPQIGRTSLGAGSNNTAIIFDPDGWDDFNGSGSGPYDSAIRQTIDLGAADLSQLSISFDYEFAVENPQKASFEVSFDGGASWILLLDLQSSDYPTDTIIASNDPNFSSLFPSLKRVWVAGTDFTATSNQLTVRYRCYDAGNNWWFAFDNVVVMADANLVYAEDFEGLELLPFGTEPAQANGDVPPGDGTDYTASIDNWVVDNSMMFTVSAENAFQGWRAIDAQSWVNQQGGQGRSLLNDLETNNTVLVADSDAQDDFDAELPADDPTKQFKEFNSIISRTYDLTNFKNTTLQISFDWESRLEDDQNGFVEVSFDNGASWTRLLDLDSAKIVSENPDPVAVAAIAPFLFAGNDQYATFNAPQMFQFGGLNSSLPAKNSNKMIMRIGYVNAQNNWWFAVDNIEVKAEPQNFVLGDANGDGILDNTDIEPFVLALVFPEIYANTYTVDADLVLDFDGDGLLTNLDIEQFINVLIFP